MAVCTPVNYFFRGGIGGTYAGVEAEMNLYTTGAGRTVFEVG